MPSHYQPTRVAADLTTIRILHWLWVYAIGCMVFSGWQIYTIGADLRAPFLSFKCFDGYSTSIDMASALHPQTILALYFDGRPLTPEWGAPVRLRIPTKLGFKSAKNLQAIEVTRIFPGGYWRSKSGLVWSRSCRKWRPLMRLRRI